ncbi:MAG: right-handed parallel beta-helix repeat-containing protein [Thermoplasmatota archaeon]
MRWVHLAVALILLAASVMVFGGLTGSQGDPSIHFEPFATVDHSPITINGNSALQTRASSEGWPGSGSDVDPYIIQNYRIMASGATCISISNTDLHLVIRGCNLTVSSQAGILLSGSSNVRITENLIGPNDADGIRLSNSPGNLIDNNTMDADNIFVMNYNGIHLIGSSSGNLIRNNSIHRSENDGIRIEDTSTDNVLSGNTLIENLNNGILLGSDRNQVIDGTLWANKVGVTVDGSDIQISGNKFRQNSWGVNLHTGGRNIVRNNNFVRNNYGVRIFISDDNQVYSNYILKSDKFGIDVEHTSASGNRIFDNHLFYNNGTGSYYVFEKRQARDLSKDNTWHSTSNRGNYWHDLRSPDNDDDGIVDAWYFLEGGEQHDFRPLVNSVIPDVFTPPKKLAAQPGKDHINLTWWPVNYGMGVRVQYFNIFKNEREGGEFYLDSAASDVLHYTDWDVVPGRSYFYYITAVTDIAESNRSNRVKSSPDVVRPTVTVGSPKEGAVFNDPDVYVDWIGVDNIAIDRFEITLDEDPTIDVGLNDHYLFLDLTEGPHTFEVRIFDMAEHNRSDTTWFIIDTIKPSIDIEAPEEGPILFDTDTPLISWSSQDIGPGIDHHMITHDGENWTRLGDVKEYQFTSPIDAGHHTITVRCVDKGGNWAEDRVEIIVDLEPPTLWIVAPAGPGYYNDRTIEIVYSSFDDLTNISEYQVRIDTGNWMSKGLARSHNFTYLDEGQHYLYVKAIDGAGNEVIVSTTGTVDMTPPELNVLNLEDGVMYNKPVTLEWEVWDVLSGMEHTRISNDGGEWKSYTTPKPVLLEVFEDGEHFVLIEAVDKAGNVLSLNISYLFDGTSPFIAFANPGGINVPINASISIMFSEAMDRESVVVDSPGIEGRLLWDGNNLTLDPASSLNYSRKYSIAVQGRDLAGNDMVPFNWFFVTVEDLSLKYGRVYGRAVTTDGAPIPYASYRFKTGEKGTCDSEGRFDTFVTTGENFIIVSNNTFRDTKVDFEVYQGDVQNLGDIPLRSEKEAQTDDEGKDTNVGMIILIVIVVTVIVIGIGIGVAYQVKKTREYNRMGPVFDEWVNVTDLKTQTHSPTPPPRTSPPPAFPPPSAGSEEGIKR